MITCTCGSCSPRWDCLDISVYTPSGIIFKWSVLKFSSLSIIEQEDNNSNKLNYDIYWGDQNIGRTDNEDPYQFTIRGLQQFFDNISSINSSFHDTCLLLFISPAQRHLPIARYNHNIIVIYVLTLSHYDRLFVHVYNLKYYWTVLMSPICKDFCRRFVYIA